MGNGKVTQELSSRTQGGFYWAHLRRCILGLIDPDAFCGYIYLSVLEDN